MDGVEIVRLATDEGEADFLLTVGVTEEVVLASVKFKWREVMPPSEMGGEEAARHVLGRIDRFACRTRIGFDEYTWLRVASELQEVRRLLAEIRRNRAV